MDYFSSMFIYDAYHADELERRAWLLLEIISIRDDSCSLNYCGPSDFEAVIYVVCTS
jgi:hypothetical protein